MTRAILVILLLQPLIRAQSDRAVPGLSLDKLSADQCAYGVEHINRFTKFVDRREVRPGTGGMFPGEQKGVDSYVAGKVTAMYDRLLRQFLAKTPREERDVKIDLMELQTDLAYVMELRGCKIARSSVEFVTP